MQTNSPFDDMYQSFRLFNSQDKEWKRNFISMSAGVNWSKPNKAVVKLLQYELLHAPTLRNYGNAGGLAPVTRVLELVERQIYKVRDLSVTITHGVTEGAYLALQYFTRSKRVRPGAGALMVGHGFPLYSRLSSEFGLQFGECLGFPSEKASLMPSEERLAAALDQQKPELIFIILPNNPLGEVIGAAAFDVIRDYILRNNAVLLIDRVCLMPWDKREEILDAVGPLLSSGQAVIVDSFSKSESLAGLRAGYLISNAGIKKEIVEIIKSRFLNPVTFPTATLAITRLLETETRHHARMERIFHTAHDTIYSEYPFAESFLGLAKEGRSLLAAYREGLDHRRKTIGENFHVLKKAFKHRLAFPLHLEAGFNAALVLPEMDTKNEIRDQNLLARDHGVGILTSRCFSEAQASGLYFIRIGLALPKQDFSRGVQRLKTFYKTLRS